MGLLQEAAIFTGDHLTQPFKKVALEFVTGKKFGVKRREIRKPQQDGKTIEKKVVWKIVPTI